MKFRITIFLFVLLVGCGKYGPPKPPEDFAPRAVRFLQASGSLDGIQLRWQAPLQDVQGEELRNLESFVVRRSIYERGERPDFEKIAEIPFEGSESLDTHIFSFLDSDVEAGGRYEYVILAQNSDSTEGLSRSILRITFRGELSEVEVRND